MQIQGLQSQPYCIVPTSCGALSHFIHVQNGIIVADVVVCASWTCQRDHLVGVLRRVLGAQVSARVSHDIMGYFVITWKNQRRVLGVMNLRWDYLAVQ